jgi:hypothetical protein
MHHHHCVAFFGLALFLSSPIFGAVPGADSAQNLNDVVIQINDDHHMGWDSGRLAVDITNDPRDTLVIEFRAHRREAITALSVSTNRWTIDLTKAVGPLKHPYASRIAVVVRKWNSTETLLFIDLPFETGSRTNGNSKCNGLQIEVRNGVAVSQTTHVTTEGRCEY